MPRKKDAITEVGTGLLRSISRRFNDALAGRASDGKGGDQRRARKLNRYRKELREGKVRGTKDLTPLDVAARVHELLEAGERLGDIRLLTKPRVIDYDERYMVDLLREMHREYRFRAEAYRFAGVRNETMVAAGILDRLPPRRGPRGKHDLEVEDVFVPGIPPAKPRSRLRKSA
jgi:hypothetical protein